MSTARTKIGLDRIVVLLGSQQIELREIYEYTYDGNKVGQETIPRHLNRGADVSGEESVVQTVANAYWGSL